jgi:hypothetical protein
VKRFLDKDIRAKYGSTDTRLTPDPRSTGT